MLPLLNFYLHHLVLWLANFMSPYILFQWINLVDFKSGIIVVTTDTPTSMCKYVANVSWFFHNSIFSCYPFNIACVVGILYFALLGLFIWLIVLNHCSIYQYIHLIIWDVYLIYTLVTFSWLSIHSLAPLFFNKR